MFLFWFGFLMVCWFVCLFFALLVLPFYYWWLCGAPVCHCFSAGSLCSIPCSRSFLIPLCYAAHPRVFCFVLVVFQFHSALCSYFSSCVLSASPPSFCLSPVTAGLGRNFWGIPPILVAAESFLGGCTCGKGLNKAPFCCPGPFESFCAFFGGEEGRLRGRRWRLGDSDVIWGTPMSLGGRARL